MSLKTKAFVNTIKIFMVSIMSTVVLFLMFKFFNPVVISTVLMGCLIAFMFYIFYKINLSQLEYEHKLKETIADLKN